MITITVKRTTKSKDPNTKTTYRVDSIEVEEVTAMNYSLTTKKETLQWYRNRGGTETPSYSYTCAGYKVTKLISTSPDKEIKIIREYTFKHI